MAAPAPARSRREVRSQSEAFLVALGLAFLLTGCSTPAQGPAPGKIEAARAELIQTDLAFSQTAANVGLAEAFFEYLAEDAVWLPNGSEPVLGREAVRDRLREAGRTQLVWEPQFADVARSGELGYTWGLYESRARGEDGRERVSQGKYTTIWRRQPDGRWRAVLDTGNPSKLLTP
jgi:ketosteroid isomerase-like protein